MSICSLYNSLKHIRKDIYHNDEYDIGFWLEDGFVCVFRTITSKFGIYQMEIIDDIYFTCIIKLNVRENFYIPKENNN